MNDGATPTLGEGMAPLTNNISLVTILVVPSLPYDHFYVAQITITLHCLVVFLPHFSVFKDIQTWRTIGYGTKKGKLY